MKIKYIITTIILIALFQNICDGQKKIPMHSSVKNSSWKQNRIELFFGAGVTNFLGDVGGANQIGTYGVKDINMSATRYDFDIGFRYRLTPKISLRTNMIYARLEGDDANTKEPYRNDRNCSFRSPIIELSEQIEYSIFSINKVGRQFKLEGVSGGAGNLKFNVYLFAGIGIFYFDPHGQYTDGNWYRLKPLCTEGEGILPGVKKYSLIQTAIPFGVGIKFALKRGLAVGIEIGIRKTTTDYLDDVSNKYVNDTIFNVFQGKKRQLATYFANPSNHSLAWWQATTAAGQERGDPKHKDMYMLAIISLNYTLHESSSKLPRYK